MASFEKTCVYSVYSARSVFLGFAASTCIAKSVGMVSLFRVAAARGVMKQEPHF